MSIDVLLGIEANGVNLLAWALTRRHADGAYEVAHPTSMFGWRDRTCAV
jgi:hypothetical protein